MNWPARSGWVVSTTVSITATVWPAPLVVVHASGASMSASATPGVSTVWPVFCNPHWFGNWGSSEAAAGVVQANSPAALTSSAASGRESGT